MNALMDGRELKEVLGPTPSVYTTPGMIGTDFNMFKLCGMEAQMADNIDAAPLPKPEPLASLITTPTPTMG